ncbi:MAG: ParA family protein [Sulfuriferula sp.]|nr:ParA family protein [Sulfuriferula sp.]
MSKLRAILIANPKGGSGKSTLAVSLAGALATSGQNVRLLDLDKQQSANAWLARRPADLPAIWSFQPNQSTTDKSGWLIIDSPAGLHGKNLERALKMVERVIVPIAPSLFDMEASRTFLDALKTEKAIRKERAFIGMVGMRVTPRTRVAQVLEDFLQQHELPILTHLQDTQAYINAAFDGKSVFDLPAYQTQREREQWIALLDWLQQ